MTESPVPGKRPPDGPLPAENTGMRLQNLFNRIEETLKRDNLFTDKDYSLKNLARDMDEREAVLSEAIKAAGFTSFREYLCDLRLEYFKRQAENRPGKYVKELIFECGFTSRSTFYRNFTKRLPECHELWKMSHFRQKMSHFPKEASHLPGQARPVFEKSAIGNNFAV